MMMNKELEAMWKYSAMTYIKTVSQNLPEGTGKNHKKKRTSVITVSVLTDIQTRHLSADCVVIV
jgi:hypothetical protein